VLQLKLESEGFRLVRAMTAEDGLAKIRELEPDVVLTDVRLPGLSGLELCRLCEPLQAQRPFLITVLTSHMVREELEWIESSPLRSYVAKPFSPRALAEMIRQYVRRSGQNSSEPSAHETVEPPLAGTGAADTNQ
jgi:CheY-like chemotaxis protein